MQQLPLTFEETRKARVERILSGQLRGKVKTAADMGFTEEAYERACALAKRDVEREAGRAEPGPRSP